MANLSAFGGAQPITPGGLVELGYGEKTSNSTITSTSAASPTATGISVTVVSDGSPLDVEFYCGEATPPNTNNGVLLAALWVDGAEYDRTMGVAYNYSDGVNSGRTLYAKKRITLSAGSHTIDIRGWLANNAGLSGYFFAGTSLSGYSPAFLRVSKIVQQNDGLKPFWTPPITASLPSNPDTGDQIIYKHGGTGNIGSHLPMIYDGTKWQPLGEAVLAWWPSGGGQTFTSTTPTALGVGTYSTQTFTPPWSGYYEITCRVEHATLTSGIGMYLALRSTDGAENYTLNYVQDVNGYTYHTSFGFPNPVIGYLNSAKTYRFYGWVTYAAGNTGYMNIARAHIKTVAG